MPDPMTAMTAEQLRRRFERIADKLDNLPTSNDKAERALDDLATEVRLLAARLSGMAADTGWISVDERLPTEKREFQIYYAQWGTQEVSEFLPDENPPCFYRGDPTHWRELPAPPEHPHG